MVGCSKNLGKGNSMCGNCGPNCLCGTNCNCPKGCKGNCYLNRPIHNKKHGGAVGCGPNGCPLPPMSWTRMNQFHGGGSKEGMFPLTSVPNGPTSYPPTLGVAQNGGTCGLQCGLQNGGAFYKTASPMPGPFVGAPWGANINQWPSVNAVSGDRNYLPSYDAKNGIIDNDPALQMKLGGRRSKKRTAKRSMKRGGGLIPQDLINLGRDMSFNFKSTYNSLNGYAAPTNPLPYKDQLMGSTKMNYNALL